MHSKSNSTLSRCPVERLPSSRRLASPPHNHGWRQHRHAALLAVWRPGGQGQVGLKPGRARQAASPGAGDRRGTCALVHHRPRRATEAHAQGSHRLQVEPVLAPHFLWGGYQGVGRALRVCVEDKKRPRGIAASFQCVSSMAFYELSSEGKELPRKQVQRLANEQKCGKQA